MFYSAPTSQSISPTFLIPIDYLHKTRLGFLRLLGEKLHKLLENFPSRPVRFRGHSLARGCGRGRRYGASKEGGDELAQHIAFRRGMVCNLSDVRLKKSKRLHSRERHACLAEPIRATKIKSSDNVECKANQRTVDTGS